MEFFDIITSLFTNYTLRTVSIGAAILGIVSGALGSFALLRRQSLLGDAMSHAALPGVVLAFLLTRTKTPVVLVLGAMIAGWLATLWMMSIVRNTRIKEDSALGLVLSVFFGFGLMLLTFAQRIPDARQAGLETFLFGQAAALLQEDIITMGILALVAILFLLVFWKEFKLLSFDTDFGASLGFPMQVLDILLTSLLVVAIVTGLQAVGVVLMSAMVVAPAAAARQWTDRLFVMVLLSSAFGALAGVTGAVISSLRSGLSTGPMIVLCASAIVLLSMLFAPNRGLVWRNVQERRSRRSLRSQHILLYLYWMAAQHEDINHPHTIDALRVTVSGEHGVRDALDRLAGDGLVMQVDERRWSLTDDGVRQARELEQERYGMQMEGGAA